MYIAGLFVILCLLVFVIVIISLPRITKVGKGDVLFVSDPHTCRSNGIHVGPCRVWYFRGDKLVRTERFRYQDSFYEPVLNLKIDAVFEANDFGFVSVGYYDGDWQETYRSQIREYLLVVAQSHDINACTVGELVLLRKAAEKLFWEDSRIRVRLGLTTEISSNMPVLLSVQDSESQKEAVVEEGKS